MDQNGVPCTNCLLDNEVCKPVQNKRRLRRATENDLPLLPRSEDRTAPRTAFEPYMNTISLASSSGDNLNQTSQTDKLATSVQISQPEPQPNVALPNYVHPIPSNVSEDHLAFLQASGALEVPEPWLRTELLKSYIEFVHPFCPVVDFPDVLRAIDKDDGSERISLLLLQAIMFAATTFIDISYLAAYENRRAAQKAFFQKAKLLYDFDYEADRVTIVQSVLLMTYHYSSHNHPKDIWYWLGIAVSLARSVGLNCNPRDSASLQERRLWKRIWWCCYMRDRLIAAGMRRPLLINQEECHVPELEMDDFESCSQSPEYGHMMGTPTVDNPSLTHKNLVQLCIAMTRLCKHIGDVLTVQYETPDHKIGGTREATMKLLPKPSPPSTEDFAHLDRTLKDWYQDLPTAIRYSFSDSAVDGQEDPVVYLHSAVLMGAYTGITSALHRPQCMSSSIGTAESRNNSRATVYDCACKIAHLFQDLFSRDMVRLVPNTGVAILLPACIVLHSDIQSPTSPTREESKARFKVCARALERLRDMHVSADFAVSVLSEAVRAAAGVPRAATTASPQSTFSTSEADRQRSQELRKSKPVNDPNMIANMLVFSSTLSPQEKQVIASFAPGAPREGLNSVMMGTNTEHLMEEDGDSSEGDDDAVMTLETEPAPAMPFVEQGLPDNTATWWDFEDLLNL